MIFIRDADHKVTNLFDYFPCLTRTVLTYANLQHELGECVIKWHKNSKGTTRKFAMQRCQLGRAFRVGSGFGPSSSSALGGVRFWAESQQCHKCVKMFRACVENILSWRTFVVLTTVISVSKVIVIFFSLSLFTNTAAFFCSLVRLVSHSFWESDNPKEISTAWHCVKEIDRLRNGLF